MANNVTSACSVFLVDLTFFESTARKYKSDALKIKGADFSSCSPGFHLLTSLVFEMFPKILLGYDVCLKYKKDTIISDGEVRKKISAAMKKYNHHLARVLKKLNVLLLKSLL